MTQTTLKDYTFFFIRIKGKDIDLQQVKEILEELGLTGGHNE